MSADFVVESSLSNRKQNGMLPENQHLVQEDQAQDKDDDQSGEGLANCRRIFTTSSLMLRTAKRSA